MKHRKLRIAWSVAWGLVAVLLCVLWVRSYWWTNTVAYQYAATRSFRGALTVGEFFFLTDEYYNKPHVWHFGQREAITKDRNHQSWSDWHHTPVWIPIVLVGATAAAPWLSRRFSLRTLLIATTAIAVVLGMIVWMAKG